MTCKYSNIIAENCGINSALIAGYLYEQQKEKGFILWGKLWYRCSVNNFTAVFPFMGKGAVYGALKRLRHKGYILRTEHNKSRFDRTKSYAFTPLGTSVMMSTEKVLKGG